MKKLFFLSSLLPDWMYGKKWIMGFIFSMMLGQMLSNINKLKRFGA